MKKNILFRLGVVLLLLAPMVAWSAPKATFFWAGYDGLTEDFRAQLESAYNAQSPDAQIQIVPVPWDSLQDKLNTAVAGGAPPDISV
ncbi:MAG TPA: extracellular solute-binding protein, partial [Spirochaetia bacterium]|nr:extracellular solute-binding protein [Spirochaetia bacterium]